MEESPDIQRAVFLISRKSFADRDKTEDRFDRMLEELKKDREENSRKWEETNKKLDETIREGNRKWEESSRKWEETNKKLDETIRESERKWEEITKRLDESNRESRQKWEETNKKLDETIRESKEHFKAIREDVRSTVGALGSRWGIASEASFRSALKGILEKRFSVQVINVTEYDHEGFVFRHPDQVELDIIIRNGDIIICEIKSSMSRSDIYTFHRKVQFYEKQHNCKAASMIVISPMLDKYAQATADRLGIEIYSYCEDVKL
jgi:hypothetical protein